MTMEPTQSKDSFGFKRGVFTLFEEDKNGNRQILEQDNTIVNSSFNIVAGALQGNVDKRITTIAFGDGGIINSVKQTPSLNDTALYHELIRITETTDIDVESILKPYYITFKFEMIEADGNGIGAQIYSEAGIFSEDGTMFARKTFNEVVKTPEKKFIVEWKLEYDI